VIGPPSLDDPADLGQAPEDVLAQAFVAQPPERRSSHPSGGEDIRAVADEVRGPVVVTQCGGACGTPEGMGAFIRSVMERRSGVIPAGDLAMG
jgi:hypothetical protein